MARGVNANKQIQNITVYLLVAALIRDEGLGGPSDARMQQGGS